METLRSYLESEDVVTARWLAHALNTKVPNARALLDQYHKENSSNYKAFFLVTGARGGSDAIIVVSEEVLASRKRTFDDIYSCEIYSLQRDERSAALPGAKPGAVLQVRAPPQGIPLSLCISC